MQGFIIKKLKGDAGGGILLGLAAIFAILVANSPLEFFYDLLLSTPVSIQVGALVIAKPLLLWVNDGLMAVFFFLVGLELKKECLEGELNHWSKAVLPGIGAIGGMAVPALVYLAFNYNDPIARNGWAVPAATDIAFALGVLSLLGPKVPISLRIFLTSLAIFDDIGAILIIAFFYTSEISLLSLLVSFLAILVLWAFKQKGVIRNAPYLLVGIVMWIAVLKSGVHATLAGVVLAMFIPTLPNKRYKEGNGLKSLEHDLHMPVAYFILPIFAFCNSGINLSGLGLEDVTHPVPIGIALGLFLGKQLGVFGFCWAGLKLGIAKWPEGMTYLHLYGLSLLTGIGFTMSLFIGSLAFEASGVDQVFDERLGILVGSIASGILGYFVLKLAMNRKVVARD